MQLSRLSSERVRRGARRRTYAAENAIIPSDDYLSPASNDDQEPPVVDMVWGSLSEPSCPARQRKYASDRPGKGSTAAKLDLVVDTLNVHRGLPFPRIANTEWT